jgi:hypothetical protein
MVGIGIGSGLSLGLTEEKVPVSSSTSTLVSGTSTDGIAGHAVMGSPEIHVVPHPPTTPISSNKPDTLALLVNGVGTKDPADSAPIPLPAGLQHALGDGDHDPLHHDDDDIDIIIEEREETPSAVELQLIGELDFYKYFQFHYS